MRHVGQHEQDACRTAPRRDAVRPTGFRRPLTPSKCLKTTCGSNCAARFGPHEQVGPSARIGPGVDPAWAGAGELDAVDTLPTHVAPHSNKDHAMRAGKKIGFLSASLLRGAAGFVWRTSFA